jgi:D-alanyl-lipoteichoic acid acyltransferase DltB (MBOAT superfamily)
LLFNSTSYLLFLTVVVLVYHRLPPAAKRWAILVASYVFYASWKFPFLGLLVASTLANYFFGLLIGPAPHAQHQIQSPGSRPPTQKHPFPSDKSRNPRRKLWLIVSLVCNLGVLCLFKYAGFFSDVSYGLLGHRLLPALHWILPLGISFYTFEVISYEVDVYHGITTPIRSLMDMALYVCFFPHLIAGPIIRSEDLVPQLTADQPFLWSNIQTGVARLIWGMVKKVYIADVMAAFVGEVYGAPSSYSGMGLLLATYAFAVQVYCDFSAYTDMAIGSALMLGIRLPENFDSPYLSCGIREFWRRWHISLSTWLRDYLYIPLGGSRRGNLRTYVNLLLTMLLGGLWHGAAWSFVVWGGLHGGVMCIERFFNVSEKPPASAAWRLVRWFVTLHVVCASWVLFRARNLTTAILIFKRIATGAQGQMLVDCRPAFYLLAIVAAELIAAKQRWISIMNNRPVLARWAAYGAATAFILTFKRATNPEFIYFQF